MPGRILVVSHPPFRVRVAQLQMRLGEAVMKGSELPPLCKLTGWDGWDGWDSVDAGVEVS